MDLSSMTDDAIVTRQQELGAQIDALREERRACADEMRRRQSAVGQAQAALAALSPDALAALRVQLAVVQPMPDVSATPAQ